jgi:hypothetical protein
MNTQSDRAIPGDKGQPSQVTEKHHQEHVSHAKRSTQEYVDFGNKHLGRLHYQSLRSLSTVFNLSVVCCLSSAICCLLSALREDQGSQSDEQC